MKDGPEDKEPAIEDAVAIVPVRDIEATVDFYADVLGFERRFIADDKSFAIVIHGEAAIHFIADDKSFAIVIHGEAAIHFVACDDDDALRATANNISIYLWVRSLDALYEKLQPSLAALPQGRVRPPFDQPYGMREFHIKDPDGCLLLFGEEP
tara:strand:+ start:1461 stop:1919 length:459 start_codon:yes stop_codon:yes gene_type:complete